MVANTGNMYSKTAYLHEYGRWHDDYSDEKICDGQRTYEIVGNMA